jgi:hypothetical protein
MMSSCEFAHLVHADACHRDALAKAVLSVRRERLTQLYRAKTGVG